MQASQFCYWLQGHFELNGPEEITADQAKTIQNHLNLVFLHDIDPSQRLSEAEAEHAQAVHDGHPTSGGAGLGGLVMRC